MDKGGQARDTSKMLYECLTSQQSAVSTMWKGDTQTAILEGKYKQHHLEKVLQTRR